MASVVYPATLDHEEETLIAISGGFVERCKGGFSHLGQRRVFVVLVLSVYFVWNIMIRKEPQQR